jgi:hypothetical protein
MRPVFVRFAKIKTLILTLIFFQICAEFSNLVEPMDDPHGTLRVHGIPVEKHCSRAEFAKVRSADNFKSARFSIWICMKKNLTKKSVI